MATPKRAPIVIAGVEVAAGERQDFEIPLAKLLTGTPLDLPVSVIHGRRPGPAMLICAAIHGDEINGVEIIRQLLGILDPARLSGTLVATPIVNVFGFIEQRRYLPDRRDLNRSFPGSQRGSLASRLANTFLNQVVAPCQYVIDLHTASRHRTNLPQIRADVEDEETRRCALAFGAPVMIHARLRDGSLRAAASRRGIRVLLFEGGEALRFDAEAIKAGVRGVLRVMSSLDMWKSSRRRETPEPFEAQTSQWVRARRSGMLHVEVALGQEVFAGRRLGFITDALGKRITIVSAPADGVVIGYATNPLVYRGDALVHVAVR
jgi:predicted deacylase